MNLSMEQQMVLRRMLGAATLKFEKCGAYFVSKRMPEMEALVEAGAVRREETMEGWGPCVTYIVTEDARTAIGLLDLRSNVGIQRRAQRSPLE